MILLGQILLAQGNEFVYNQKPIDFAHWFLLIGVTLLLPHLFKFKRSIFSYLGIPLTLIGIVCTIGMCVLDFIWWSYPNDESRLEFTNHITTIPSIWDPFIAIGSSSKVFNVGLMLLSFNYFKSQKIGILFVVVGTLVLLHVIPVPYRLVSGYTLTLIGFTFFHMKKPDVLVKLGNSNYKSKT